MTQPEFNYETFVKQKLQSNPVGHTTDSLTRKLPEDASESSLEDAIQELSRQGNIKQIGDKWRWMSFN